MTQLGVQQELVWDSLCSMYKRYQSEREEHNLSIFELSLVDALLSDMQSNELLRVLSTLKQGLGGAEVFLLQCDSAESATVIASTITSELHLRWPLTGPFLRCLGGHPSIVYNARRIPIFKALSVVQNGQAISMVMRAWTGPQARFMLIAVHPEVGHFLPHSQSTLDRCVRTLEGRGQALLEALIATKDQVLQASEVTNTECTVLWEHTELNTKGLELSSASLSSPKRNTQAPTGAPKWEGCPQLNNRYSLVEKLGVGGFGTVYKAYDRRINRVVALKVLKDSKMDSGKGHLSFAREAAMAAAVRHPNIVTIFDLGYDERDQRPYIVMEYLEGIDLSEELKRSGSLSLQKMLRIVLPVLDALGAGHRIGLVHRDLKPSNLFLERSEGHQDQPRILDFGIAISMTDTTEKSIAGTLNYLAPELIRFNEVSPRLDVYQMGLVIMQLLTNAPPIKSSGYNSTIKEILSGNICRPEAYLDHPLDKILCCATAMEPADRYADALEFKAALEELCQ